MELTYGNIYYIIKLVNINSIKKGMYENE